jgi:hypothetical protein
MSACIYHDAEAVAVCPSCDFAVCQGCLDNGADGMCEECAGARDRQAAMAAVEEVERCKYCRIASDEETILDMDGYCASCAALPRCATHDDLIAFDACKSCRQQYCRKCLGFNNVCEACTLKQKAAPPRPKPPASAGGTGAVKREGAKAGTGAVKKGTGAVKKGTGPIKGGTGPIKAEAGDRPKPKRPRPPGPGAKPTDAKGRKRPEPELDEKGRPKKKPPSRGTAAMASKMDAQLAGRARKQMVAMAVVIGAIAIILMGSMMVKASSPEAQTKAVQEQMVAVQQAVVAFNKSHSHWPASAEDIRGQLTQMGVPGASKFKIATKPAPSTVIYQLSGEDGFLITGTDAEGQVLKSSNGNPIALDQYFSP